MDLDVPEQAVSREDFGAEQDAFVAYCRDLSQWLSGKDTKSEYGRLARRQLVVDIVKLLAARVATSDGDTIVRLVDQFTAKTAYAFIPDKIHSALLSLMVPEPQPTVEAKCILNYLSDAELMNPSLLFPPPASIPPPPPASIPLEPGYSPESSPGSSPGTGRRIAVPSTSAVRLSLARPAVASTLDAEQLRLFRSVPTYSADTLQSFEYWRTQVEAFLATFNVSPAAIEPHLASILRGRAAAVHTELQTRLRHKGVKYPSWLELQRALKPLDNPIRRSFAVHRILHSFTGKSQPVTKASIDKFLALERQLDPGPLGDRVFWLVRLFAPLSDLIMEYAETSHSVEHICHFIMIVAESRTRVVPNVCTLCLQAKHENERCLPLRLSDAEKGMLFQSDKV